MSHVAEGLVSKVVFFVAVAILFCDVFRRCVAFFVAGAAPWRPPHRHFAWQAQHFRRVVLRAFGESHCEGYVEWRHVANCMVGVTFCEMS